MDIAFCHHLSLSYNGGGEKWLINLSKELVKRGHSISIHCLPFTLKDKKCISNTQLGSIPYTEKLFHNIHADVSYVTYNPLSFLNFHIHGKKIAGFHTQTYEQKTFNHQYGFLPSIAKLANDIFGSQDIKRFNAIHRLTPNTYTSPQISTYIIPNYVDSTIYKPSKKPEEFTVTYASRKVWQKGYDIYRLAKQALKSKVNFQESGSIPERDMPHFLSQGHVTIAPSRVDTFGLSLVESLMCGTPVITTSILPHKRLNAKLFYADTPLTITNQILKLKTLFETDTKTYNALCATCRSSVMQYDKLQIVNQLESMFKEVAS